MIRAMHNIDRIDDWAAAVNNRAAVPDHETHFAAWVERAAAYRAENPPQEHSYGPAEREAFDLWLPEEPVKGVLIFFHGGWWMNFDKSCFSDLAAGPLANGWAMAIPSYTLAPAITLTDLVAQARRAVEAVAGVVDDVPLVIAGHSAGGHLAAMAAVEGALSDAAHARLCRVVSISGVHDLRPLRGIPINDTLSITAEEADALSPALLRPRAGFDLVAWAGALELPEFLRQNAMLGVAWGGYADTRVIEAPELDHFTAFAPIADPASTLTCLVTAQDVPSTRSTP